MIGNGRRYLDKLPRAYHLHWVIQMGAQVKVLQKGKITIPADIRERLAIRVGDSLTIEVKEGRLVLLTPRTLPNPTDMLTGLTEGVAVKEPVKKGLQEAGAARLGEKRARAAG